MTGRLSFKWVIYGTESKSGFWLGYVRVQGVRIISVKCSYPL